MDCSDCQIQRLPTCILLTANVGLLWLPTLLPCILLIVIVQPLRQFQNYLHVYCWQLLSNQSDWQIQYYVHVYCWQPLSNDSNRQMECLLTCILLIANVGPLWLTNPTLLMHILLTASVQPLWQMEHLLTCILLTANVGLLWLTDPTLLTCMPVAYRGGWFGGFKLPPKFRSFDKAQTNSHFCGKYIRNCLVFLFHHPN
jgi:hypothetical protein